MKFIITENKLNKVTLLWMNKNFSPDQLEIVTSEKYPESIFFMKDGKVMMEQDNSMKYFIFDLNEIWLFFKRFFELEYDEVREVLKYWLEKTLGLEGYDVGVTTPFRRQSWNRLLD